MEKEPINVVELVFDVLHKMNIAVAKHMKSTDYYDEGLNKSHIKTIVVLRCEKSGTMTEIGQRVELVKGAFTPLVDRLIELGYVQKTNSPNDRRKVILTLTSKGEAYADKIGADSSASFEAGFGSMTARERREFLRHLEGLEKLLTILNEK